MFRSVTRLQCTILANPTLSHLLPIISRIICCDDSGKIAQSERGDFNGSTDLHKLSREAPDQTSRAAQQELENGSQPLYYSSIEHGDRLDSEHATSDSQHSASLEISTPAEHNSVSDNDAHPSGLPFTQSRGEVGQG